MPLLRERTLKEIKNLLNRLHSDAFLITNSPDESPFLTIMLKSDHDFIFTVSLSDSVTGGFVTRESPGIYLVDGEYYERSNFRIVIQAILAWAKRVQKDLKLHPAQYNNRDITELSNGSMLAQENTSEIILMKRTQKELEKLLLTQSKKMKIIESALSRLESEQDQNSKKEPVGARLTL